MRNINIIAEALQAARARVAEIRQFELDVAEEEEEDLRAELLEAMKESRLKSVKVEGGPVFARSERINYSVIDKIKALAWAKRNKCVAVDKAAANKILRTKYPDMPAGFEVEISEYITVRSDNNEIDTTGQN